MAHDELTYEMNPGEAVTHFSLPDCAGLICLDLRCATKGMTAQGGGPDGYHDEDCNGNLLECSACGAYIFPEGAAAEEAEYRYMEQQFRAGLLGRRVTPSDLDAYEVGDPKRVFYEQRMGQVI